jgi:large subunit ribosomal protein L24
MSLRIKKGDKVFILAGKDKGKSGRVVAVYPKQARALVEGIGMVKKHARKSPKNPQGGILHQESPIAISNLSLFCPVSNKPTRIKTLLAQDGSKQRVSAKNKAVIA